MDLCSAKLCQKNWTRRSLIAEVAVMWHIEKLPFVPHLHTTTSNFGLVNSSSVIFWQLCPVFFIYRAIRNVTFSVADPDPGCAKNQNPDMG
jgi:hypothetical protein